MVPNLTLTRSNPELGVRPFAEKRDTEGGYGSSGLQTLDADLRKSSVWNRKALKQRGRRLAKLALSVWSYPDVPDEILEEARERARRTWTLEDHPQLQPGTPMRELYDLICLAFDKLDLQAPEPLRKYISFKAQEAEGANVVDITPLRHQLKCYLNTTLDQLSDPHGMAISHPRKKHCGTGHVLVVIQTGSQVPALVELVRQVLDQQQAQSDPDSTDSAS